MSALLVLKLEYLLSDMISFSSGIVDFHADVDVHAVSAFWLFDKLLIASVSSAWDSRSKKLQKC